MTGEPSRPFTIKLGGSVVGSATEIVAAAALAGALYTRSGSDVSVENDTTGDVVAVINSDAAPFIERLDPAQLPANGTDTNMHVNGRGFREGCAIVFNGNEERTTWESSGHVSTTVKASIFETPVDVPVSVRNPDGTESNQLTFSFV